MSYMKKVLPILIIFLTFAVITIVLTFVPVQSLLKQTPLFGQIYNNTKLTINTPKSKAKITINDKDYGETNQVISNLAEGTYTVKLSRIVDETNQTDFYQDKSFIVELLNDKEAIIDVEIGPAGQASGYVTYYSVSPTSSGLISVKTSPEDENVFLDNDFISKAPFNARKLKASNYKLKTTAVGYEDIEIPIIVKDGFNLNVHTYSFPIPVNINKAE